MKKVNIIQFLLLLIVNFIIVAVINYIFLRWIANKADTTINSIVGKSIVMAIVLTVLFSLFNKKKRAGNE